MPAPPSRSDFVCYTDGSCKAGEDAPGGWGFFIKGPGEDEREGYGSETRTLAKVMEYRAVAEALAVLPERAHVKVFSDNQSLVTNLATKLRDWSESAFVNVDEAISASVRAIDASIRDKGLTVSFQWVRAHNGNEGNERADALAAKGAREAKASFAAKGDAKRTAKR